MVHGLTGPTGAPALSHVTPAPRRDPEHVIPQPRYTGVLTVLEPLQRVKTASLSNVQVNCHFIFSDHDLGDHWVT